MVSFLPMRACFLILFILTQFAWCREPAMIWKAADLSILLPLPENIHQAIYFQGSELIPRSLQNL